MAIGERTTDSNQFVKNDDIREKFMNSPAYAALFIELLSDAKASALFINSVIPKSLQEEAARLMQKEEATKEE